MDKYTALLEEVVAEQQELLRRLVYPETGSPEQSRALDLAWEWLGQGKGITKVVKVSSARR